MSKVVNENTVRKTLLLNTEKLRKVRIILGASSDSEAIRMLIEQALAYEEALQAARRIQQHGTFGRDWDELKKEGLIEDASDF
ncbi:hypothetical protein FJZ31_04875 [Candidatus Poribacteria bacterium]|nr:hypothetical protein [Candidatus Poribacteria bacterium]